MAAFRDAEQAFEVLSDRAALERLFSSIEAERIEDVIAALEIYEEDYPGEAVPIATIVLLNLMPTLPARPRGMLDMDARMVVGRVILRLLRQIPSPDDVARIVKEVLPEITTLSSRFQLISIVGHVENAGHKLVAPEIASEMEGEFAAAARGDLPADISDEWDLLTTLYWAYQKWGAQPSTVDLKLGGHVHAQILRTAQTEARSTTGSSHAIWREKRLPWNTLIKLYGDEETLRQAIESARSFAMEDGRFAESINLADKYVQGWRPDFKN
ncbi:hypothetical protein Vqi01_01450 [Micromonospora qiuiae]|uniref:Uncharacterized protein n=2 Tax=Micromonospora qiuiae TaxID=502268 RepID=A0ABQ4J494_9ACTN|nr:hypothetical protein Vqi01_01450 [Micromonospora qiuiae]